MVKASVLKAICDAKRGGHVINERTVAFDFHDRSLAKVFDISKTLANRYINRLIKEGYLRRPAPNKRYLFWKSTWVRDHKNGIYRNPRRVLYFPTLLKWAYRTAKKIARKRFAPLFDYLRANNPREFFKTLREDAQGQKRLDYRIVLAENPMLVFREKILGKRVWYFRDVADLGRRPMSAEELSRAVRNDLKDILSIPIVCKVNNGR